MFLLSLDLELNRDFNGEDYEYEDEAKLVIFPDHFEIPLPNIEELPALVSELVSWHLCVYLHDKHKDALRVFYLDMFSQLPRKTVWKSLSHFCIFSWLLQGFGMCSDFACKIKLRSLFVSGACSLFDTAVAIDWLCFF